ncbi:penicillin-insensitive murein endopeptidase [Siculibacillus lacustris]|uniref:Penicillin-insensitive murein endopeptidase n=1 Tax=Siculibacillus lacustris TaxID=1549641 RepID=A0A4Q9VXJ5_9HYPH|nr:penicillin-insensitive murein endopeptidase [Siculibacillus lacustris]TBW41216.1 penicillin-insensitive murein endopeptidase [Siculibacillus lacustris]
MSRLAALLALVLLALPATARAQAAGEEAARDIAAARAALPSDAAKVLFGGVTRPAPLAARSIGAYAKGCLAGAVALPVDGATWAVMRLSRNRAWGHPALIAFLEHFAEEGRKIGWPGLLVGDMSQPRGGPMLTGHASHQIGLDADVWFSPLPDRRPTAEERETISAVSMVTPEREIDATRWTETRARLVRAAALDPRVARIFVHPAIKKTLCGWASGDRAWLAKVRPWWGHTYHFHIRLACPAGTTGCVGQDPVPAGDGCGADLAWWLGPEPWRPSEPGPEKPPMKLADLPAACREVLTAP